MKLPVLLSALVLTALFSGCQLESASVQPEATEVKTIEVREEVMAQEEVDSVPESSMEAEAESTSVYQEFSQDGYDQLLGNQPFALFFHASWCPTCVAMEEDILDNLEGFSEENLILKADYDTEDELKATYGITSQSMVVVINAQGEVETTLVAPSAMMIQSELAKLQ